LFPEPKEINLDCSCPDWADLCKHVAATLYGIGSKLDQNPALLFLLRGVDPADLISRASAAEAVRQTVAPPNGAPSMNESDMAEVFGIELAPPSESYAPSVAIPAPEVTRPVRSAPLTPRPKAPAKAKIRRRLSAVARARIAAAAKVRWAKALRTPK